MSTAATASLPIAAQMLQVMAAEQPTTMKVLKAVPANQLDFKPHPSSWPVGQLAWHIAYAGYGLAATAAAGTLEVYKQPPVPATLDEILAGADRFYQQACDVVSKITAKQLQGQIPLPNGKTFPSEGLFGILVSHQVHHRGQLSVYLRIMGAKVPSIYGPSGDDNPFA